MRVVVRSVREELVIGREVRLGHLERHDCWVSQVSRASIRPRPSARRISPRSSHDKESFARAFGGSRERARAQVMRFSSSARFAHVEVARGLALESAR